jgi:hypothetical protein
LAENGAECRQGPPLPSPANDTSSSNKLNILRKVFLLRNQLRLRVSPGSHLMVDYSVLQSSHDARVLSLPSSPSLLRLSFVTPPSTTTFSSTRQSQFTGEAWLGACTLSCRRAFSTTASSTLGYLTSIHNSTKTTTTTFPLCNITSPSLTSPPETQHHKLRDTAAAPATSNISAIEHFSNYLFDDKSDEASLDTSNSNKADTRSTAVFSAPAIETI